MLTFCIPIFILNVLKEITNKGTRMDGIKITKEGTKGFIRHMIKTNVKWALRALVVIYNQQDSDEKMFSSSNKHNGRGFGKVDASLLSTIAERYIRTNNISARDIVTVQNKVSKYAGQIYDLSDKTKLETNYRQFILNRENTIQQ